jgi:hypothetical protein
MKTEISHPHTGFASISLLLVWLLFFSSCTRGIDKAAIEAMPAGAAKDSALLHYDYGMSMNQPLVLFTQPSDSTHGLYSNPNHYGQNKIPEDIRLNAGDTIVPTGYRTFSIPSKLTGKNFDATLIRFDLIKAGKVAASGWSQYNNEYAPLAWTRIFADYVSWIIIVCFLSILFVLLSRTVMWFYHHSRRKKKLPDVTKQRFWGLYLYLLVSLWVTVMCVYLIHHEEEALNIYYHPNMFAHWSEYATMTQLIPVVALLWLASIVAMGVEMYRKMRSGWFYFNYLAWLFLGFLIISLGLIVSWIIYILLPTIIGGIYVLGIASVFGKIDKATGGALTNSSTSTNSFGYYDDRGQKHITGVDRDNANRKIRGE